MYSFHKYNVYYLTMNEYNEISNSLKDAVEKFNNEVRDIQSKNEDLKPYDENTEKQETDKIYEFVSEIDTVLQRIIVMKNLVYMLKNYEQN